MSFSYIYTKSNCTPKKLTNEISANLVINPSYVIFDRSLSVNNLNIYFDSALTAPEEAQLDIIVANHIGDNLEATFILGHLLIQDNLFSSGVATANTMSVDSFSAQTIYSGSTNLYDIFQPFGANTVIGNGTNTYTAGTFYNQTVNVSALTINSLIVSGASQLDGTTANSFSGGTVSGGTITSGSTNLYSIFTPSGFSKVDFQVIPSGDSSSLTTTSTSFVDVPGMSAASRNFGTSATTYRVEFNCHASNSTNNAQIIVKLQKNGVDLSGTTRNVTMAAANQRLSITTVGFATGISSGDTFKAQWMVNAGTARMTGRTFSILGTVTNNVI